MVKVRIDTADVKIRWFEDGEEERTLIRFIYGYDCDFFGRYAYDCMLDDDDDEYLYVEDMEEFENLKLSQEDGNEDDFQILEVYGFNWEEQEHTYGEYIFHHCVFSSPDYDEVMAKMEHDFRTGVSKGRPIEMYDAEAGFFTISLHDEETAGITEIKHVNDDKEYEVYDSAGNVVYNREGSWRAINYTQEHRDAKYIKDVDDGAIVWKAEDMGRYWVVDDDCCGECCWVNTDKHIDNSGKDYYIEVMYYDDVWYENDGGFDEKLFNESIKFNVIYGDDDKIEDIGEGEYLTKEEIAGLRNYVNLRYPMPILD